MTKLFFAAIAASILTIGAFGQPRPADQGSRPKPPAAPASFSAKYEGGMFGYTKKESGTLKFDDTGSRLVFFDDAKKELFGIPYAALLVIYPQSQSVTSTTGNVVKYIPLPGAGLAGFIKEKRRFLIIQFDDPDVDAKGVVNFKLDNKELLDSVLQTLGDKANMTQRGDAFYRPRSAKSDT